VVIENSGGSPRRRTFLPDTDFSRDEYQLIEQLRQIEKRLAEGLAGFQTFFLPRVFQESCRLWLWIVLIIVCAGAAVKMPAQFGLRAISYEQGWRGAGALLALVFGIYFFGRSKARSARGSSRE
jgi:multidrug transporter EmrE-like cation transporter